jgi:hypothetical protein
LFREHFVGRIAIGMMSSRGCAESNARHELVNRA